MRALTKGLKLALINVVVLALLFMLAEGVASTTLVAYRIFKSRGLSEQYHSRYDETLGWVSLPNVNLPDQYGPGVYLKTNAQGFRNDRDVTRELPSGKTRIICSGDSYTLGFGVSNAQAWCQQLAALDPRLETVNMGQGGYGVDQAYLWYMRDGTPLDQNILLFGFITDDFNRMQRENFLGYGKPMLSLRGDAIVVANYPVPRTSRFTRWYAVNGQPLGGLQIRTLSSIIAARLSGSKTNSSMPDSATARQQRARSVTAKIFDNLARATREKNAKLVLVYFAGPGDYRRNDETTPWRQFVREEAERQGIPIIDFIEIFRRVPPTEIADMFAPNSHYSVRGNEFVAQKLYEELKPLLAAQPTTSARDD